jgi:HIRAN domain
LLEGVAASQQPMIARIRHFSTYLAGVTHRNSDGTPRQKLVRDLGKFDNIFLRLEPENPHDPNAVMIIRERDEQQIGYLPRDVAAVVAPSKQSGFQYGGWVLEVRDEHDDQGRSVCFVDLLVMEAIADVTASEAQRYTDRVIRPEYGLGRAPDHNRKMTSFHSLATLAIVILILALALVYKHL